jgi:hypothetical protein
MRFVVHSPAMNSKEYWDRWISVPANREKTRRWAAERRADAEWRDAENAKKRAAYALNPRRKTAAEQAKGLAAQRRRFGIPQPPYPKPDHCECCGGPPGKKPLVCDHDHQTGAFRGWLCNRCNLGIGQFGDTVEGLMRAVAYLQAAALLGTLGP